MTNNTVKHNNLFTWDKTIKLG